MMRRRDWRTIDAATTTPSWVEDISRRIRLEGGVSLYGYAESASIVIYD